MQRARTISHPHSIGQFNMLDEIAGVFFAGGGGADDGIERWTTIPVAGAINHDEAAILMHKTNHPFTEHYREDVFAVDPDVFCRGRKMGFAWFSPDCTHFSRAKGGTPVKKEIRGLSWVIVKWALSKRPRVMIMENVPEIRTWGPLIQNEKGESFPDPERKGETFDGFLRILTTGIERDHPALVECCEFLKLDINSPEVDKLVEGLGYQAEWKELCAADFGVPTTRTRFFGVFRCDGHPIVWPEPTHAPKDSNDVKAGKKLPWVGANTILDFSLPAPSIFDSKEEIRVKHDMRSRRPLRPNTMRRIARGLDKFVLKSGEPFIVEVNHAGDFRGQTLQEPLTTITAKHGRGLVRPVMSPYTVTNTSNSTGSRGDEPVNTVRTGGGGGQILVTPFLAQYHQEQSRNVRGQDLHEPLMTVDTANRYGVVAPILTKYYGNDKHGQSAESPLHTVTAHDREGMVITHICKFKGTNIGQHPAAPLQTITATAGEFAAVHTTVVKYEPYTDLKHWPEVRAMLNEFCGYDLADDELLLLNINGAQWFISDIGLRMLTPREAFNAQGFAPDYIIDVDYLGNPYPKTEQMARCGNAVCPPVAGILTAVNLPEYARKKPIDTLEAWRNEIAV